MFVYTYIGTVFFLYMLIGDWEDEYIETSQRQVWESHMRHPSNV